ncbi:hypothetical protein [Burkholderia contaminans]|uniref:Uncharacterized protein n=1 Tax=Burkholderia contaminans TaxID=488447 RepID=A0A250LEL9_9BURK|nr:hypothetical protein BCCH1_44720 [Burkholderia contaminans]GLZ68229.1 hypothetical protein Bcon01_12740 [Burkholderia contaminans]
MARLDGRIDHLPGGFMNIGKANAGGWIDPGKPSVALDESAIDKVLVLLQNESSLEANVDSPCKP